MKKALGPLILTIGLFAVVMLTNCAEPLDITNQPVPHDMPNIDTLVVHDTIIVTDTVTESHVDTLIVIDTIIEGGTDTLVIVDTITEITIDTLVVVDTVTQIDTLTIVDTVFVTTDSTRMMCGRIEACQKDIVWVLNNEAGEYHLAFAALLERDQPPQSLTVEVAGTEYAWNTAESANLVVDSWLSENAVIRIVSNKPPARGHAVYVCLSLNPR